MLRPTANPEVLYVHNSSTAARPLTPRGAPDNAHHAWAAVPDACPASAVGGCAAVALFNAGNATQQVVVQLDSLNLNLDLDKPADSDAAANSTDAQLQLCGRDLWTRRPLRGTPVLDVFAPKVRAAHAAVVRCRVALLACGLLMGDRARADPHARGGHVRAVVRIQLHGGRRHVRAAAARQPAAAVKAAFWTAPLGPTRARRALGPGYSASLCLSQAALKCRRAQPWRATSAAGHACAPQGWKPTPLRAG